MSISCAVTHRKEDAARKWCPFSWTRRNLCSETVFSCEGDPEDGRHDQPDDQMASDCRCLANACMAWIDETDYFHGIAIGRCGLVSLARM
jgi:hypothetical protein